MLDELLAPFATTNAGTITRTGLAREPSLRFVTPDQVRVVITFWRLGGIVYTRLELTPPIPLPRFDIDTRFLVNLPEEATKRGRAFASRGPDAALVIRIWTQPFATKLAERRVNCFASSKGDVLVVEQEGASHEIVEGLLALALEIVRFDVYGIRVMAEIPDATLVSEGGFVHAEVPGPSRIVIGPTTRRKVTCTRATLWSAVRDISEDVRQRVGQLGASIETTADATAITWPTIEDQRDRLLAAIMILRQLAGTSLGAFR